MPYYKVLVSHNARRSSRVVELEDTEQTRNLVEAGYLRELEVRRDATDVVVLGDDRDRSLGDQSGSVRPKRARKAVVTDEPDSAEPGDGLPDGQEQGL